MAARGDTGQALVETALMLPALLALAALLLVGGQLLSVEVALTDAAAAGALAAAAAAGRGAPALAAATVAADAEGGPLSCAGPGLPPGCVSVATATGTESGVALQVVTVYASVVPWWLGGAALQLRAQGAAAE